MFQDHLGIVFTRVRKTIDHLRKLNSILPRTALMTIFKAFDRPQLDYGHDQHDQAFNSVFDEKLESSQYNTCLA